MTANLDTKALRLAVARREASKRMVCDKELHLRVEDPWGATASAWSEIHRAELEIAEAATALLDAAEERDRLRAKVEEQNDAMAEAWEVLAEVGVENPTLAMACAQLMRSDMELRIELGKCDAERDALRAELSWIDSVLARRPALDKPTRAANIEHAINVAKQADALKDEVAKLQLSASDVEFHGNEQIKTLRSENERLREALTPSGSTKAAYIGEFVFSLPSDPFDGSEVAVPWTTIKDIMAAISKRAALRGEEGN